MKTCIFSLLKLPISIKEKLIYRIQSIVCLNMGYVQ